MTLRLRQTLAILAAALVLAPAAGAQSPQDAVSAFCRLDADGARLSAWDMQRIAPLIGWPLEPAWDRVVLVNGYTVRAAVPLAPNRFEVAIDYAVVGSIDADGFVGESRSERVIVHVRRLLGAWRLVGIPFEPRLFANRVDTDGMRRILRGERGGIRNSALVFELMHAAAWDVPPESTRDLLSGGSYAAVDQPQAGDLAVYLRDGAPYHVGLLEAPGVVVSATLAAGVVRATLRTFAGEVRYLRLRREVAVLPQPPPTPTP